jgi:hypothetical protein
MYRVNAKKLRDLIDSLGEFGLAQASQGARVSVSLLEKLYAGTYKSSPRRLVRQWLASFFKVDESELFLETESKESTKAS